MSNEMFVAALAAIMSEDELLAVMDAAGWFV